VRFAPYVLASVLLLTACRRKEETHLSPDTEMRKKLPGIWVFEPKYASGRNDQRVTTTVAADGSYVTSIALPGRTNGPRTIKLEGTWRIEDGFLIDTITKDSQTNSSVPRTSRDRIIRIDDRELELADPEKNPGTVSPTNQIIMRRKTG
jgi:hypothetical protein